MIPRMESLGGHCRGVVTLPAHCTFPGQLRGKMLQMLVVLGTGPNVKHVVGPQFHISIKSENIGQRESV